MRRRCGGVRGDDVRRHAESSPGWMALRGPSLRSDTKPDDTTRHARRRSARHVARPRRDTNGADRRVRTVPVPSPPSAVRVMARRTNERERKVRRAAPWRHRCWQAGGRRWGGGSRVSCAGAHGSPDRFVRQLAPAFCGKLHDVTGRTCALASWLFCACCTSCCAAAVVLVALASCRLLSPSALLRAG